MKQIQHTWDEIISPLESEVTQSRPTLWDSMDCSLPGSSIHGILQARILEWVAISSFRRPSRPRAWTRVSHIVGRRPLPSEPPRKPSAVAVKDGTAVSACRAGAEMETWRMNLWTQWEGEGGMKLEIRIGVHTPPCGSQTAHGSCCVTTPWSLGGWQRDSGGRVLCLQVAAPLLYSWNWHSILNQLYSNKKKEEKSPAPSFSWHETLALVSLIIRVNKISSCEK